MVVVLSASVMVRVLLNPNLHFWHSNAAVFVMNSQPESLLISVLLQCLMREMPSLMRYRITQDVQHTCIPAVLSE